MTYWRYTKKGVRASSAISILGGKVRMWKGQWQWQDATDAELLALRLDGLIEPQPMVFVAITAHKG